MSAPNAKKTDPRVNLALVMERAGRTEDARAAYESALEVRPDHIAAIQGLAMLAVRRGEIEPRLAAWLDRIAVEGEDASWREWARSNTERL